MKLSNYEILRVLVNPIMLLDDDDLFTYNELRVKAPKQAQTLLDNALIAYYRLVRPSCNGSETRKPDTDEQILKYGISGFVQQLISEEAYEQYLKRHTLDYISLGGNYTTQEEQAHTLNKPDFDVQGNTKDVKTTHYLTFDEFVKHHTDNGTMWKMHKTDMLILFCGFSYNRTNNTLYFKDNVERCFKTNDFGTQYAKLDFDKDLDLELKQLVQRICNIMSIKCRIYKLNGLNCNEKSNKELLEEINKSFKI